MTRPIVLAFLLYAMLLTTGWAEPLPVPNSDTRPPAGIVHQDERLLPKATALGRLLHDCRRCHSTDGQGRAAPIHETDGAIKRRWLATWEDRQELARQAGNSTGIASSPQARRDILAAIEWLRREQKPRGK